MLAQFLSSTPTPLLALTAAGLVLGAGLLSGLLVMRQGEKRQRAAFEHHLGALHRHLDNMQARRTRSGGR